MSEPDGPTTAERRQAAFDELMRIENDRNRAPVSGLAVATLVFGILGGVLALVFGFFAISQIRDGQRRGTGFVVAGFAAFVAWVVYLTVLATSPAGPQPVNGVDLKAGECFQAPGMSGEVSVVRTDCTEPHTGEAFTVFTVPDGTYPGSVELFDESIARCQSEVAGMPADGRVQVMTPSPETWEKRKSHTVVCYFRFSDEVTHPL
ncbi:DUF4190 domain-containing protein [Actinophytocola oryzae]|uniref:Uncharacterized protein n=1 Tax=Actinophytocola oryzae TaxID=502181 RepID=A0A4V3FSK9_9PSEU|nr:DUF4190 domain-containing protein [Actinophytocola oryzae]TDV47861.1 hypothetical protein CLV71_10996 [Actinophytocola oryzae]